MTKDTQTTLDAIWCDSCCSIKHMKQSPVDDSKSDRECPYIEPIDLMCVDGHVVTTVYKDRRLHV